MDLRKWHTTNIKVIAPMGALDLEDKFLDDPTVWGNTDDVDELPF